MDDPTPEPPVETQEPTLTNRRDVLRQAGVLLAVLAVPTLAHADPDGEGDRDDDGRRGALNTPAGKGTLDLGAVSGFKPGSVTDRTAQGGVVVARTASGLIALSPVCTHQGCTVPFSGAAQAFVCPCHGARFAPDGAVTGGPARDPLSRYALQVRNGRVLVDTNRLVRRSRVSGADFVKP